MDDGAIARTLHVLAVVLWIGGVGFVTTVLIPAVRRLKNREERLPFFESVERRFAWQARGTTGLTGLTGFYMVVRFDLWDRFSSLRFWWMHAMVFTWAVFSALLFVAEPLFLDRRLRSRAREQPESTFRIITWLHRILLTLSLLTVLGAVAGSHGLLP